MSVTVEIAGDAALVKIEVFGYERPSATHLTDANWLSCQVEVNVIGFEGHLVAAFTTLDFAEFRTTLRSGVADLKGQALFETDEDALRLRIEFSPIGHVSISGVLRDVDRPETSLTFSIESDQTYMRRTVEMLDEVLRRFPVRTCWTRRPDDHRVLPSTQSGASQLGRAMLAAPPRSRSRRARRLGTPCPGHDRPATWEAVGSAVCHCRGYALQAATRFLME